MLNKQPKQDSDTKFYQSASLPDASKYFYQNKHSSSVLWSWTHLKVITAQFPNNVCYSEISSIALDQSFTHAQSILNACGQLSAHLNNAVTNTIFSDIIWHLHKKWKAAVLPQLIDVKFYISENSTECNMNNAIIESKHSSLPLSTSLTLFLSIPIPFALFYVENGEPH